jgi:hypothetical protein
MISASVTIFSFKKYLHAPCILPRSPRRLTMTIEQREPLQVVLNSVF